MTVTTRARGTALAAAGAEGLTDFELEAAVGVKQTSIGKRRGELTTIGLVARLMIPDADHPCGSRPARRPAPSGAPSAVWAITPLGIEYAAKVAGGGFR